MPTRKIGVPTKKFDQMTSFSTMEAVGFFESCKLKITAKTIQRYCKSGKLASETKGNRLIITRSDIEKLRLEILEFPLKRGPIPKRGRVAAK